MVVPSEHLEVVISRTVKRMALTTAVFPYHPAERTLP